LQELVVRVELPSVASASAIELDVVGQQLVLAVPGRFLLQLALPHTVDAARSRAAFNRDKGQLALTLPVLPPQPHAVPAAGAAAAFAADGDVPLGLAEGCCEQDGPAELCVQLGAPGPSGGGGGRQEPAAGWCPSSAQAAKPTLTDNQLKWAELHRAAAADPHGAKIGEEEDEAAAEPGPDEAASSSERAAGPAAAGPSEAAGVSAPPAAAAAALKPRLRCKPELL
jgi:hypothetical protein